MPGKGPAAAWGGSEPTRGGVPGVCGGTLGRDRLGGSVRARGERDRAGGARRGSPGVCQLKGILPVVKGQIKDE